jgi:hypothetical protein
MTLLLGEQTGSGCHTCILARNDMTCILSLYTWARHAASSGFSPDRGQMRTDPHTDKCSAASFCKFLFFT